MQPSPKPASKFRRLIAAAALTVTAAGATGAYLATQSEPAKPDTGSASVRFTPSGCPGCFSTNAWKPR